MNFVLRSKTNLTYLSTGPILKVAEEIKLSDIIKIPDEIHIQSHH